MKAYLVKLSSFILPLGVMIGWLVGLDFIVVESSDVLVNAMAYIIITPFVFATIDHIME